MRVQRLLTCELEILRITTCFRVVGLPTSTHTTRKVDKKQGQCYCSCQLAFIFIVKVIAKTVFLVLLLPYVIYGRTVSATTLDNGNTDLNLHVML